MFNKKWVLFVMAVLVVLSMSFVAADSNDFFADSTELTLHGVEFNIPAGYEEDVSQRVVEEQETSIMDQRYSSCIYKNGDKKINITVKYSNEGKLTGYTNIYGRNTTLSNVYGCLLEDESKITDNSVAFLYLLDGKGVYISAPDVATLEEIIKEQ